MVKKLTVEQVRKCVLVVYYEGYNDGYLNRGCHFEETDWQAITDEINSQIVIDWVDFVRERTCRIEWRYDSFNTNTGYEHDGEYFCTACNSELLYLLQEYWDDYQAGDIAKPFNYCPNCGAKVVNER